LRSSTTTPPHSWIDPYRPAETKQETMGQPHLTLEEYRIVRSEIEHEDQLINHRLSWLVSSQSFLLTGFAISLNAPVSFLSPAHEQVSKKFFHLLPYAGLCTVALIYPTILAAIIAMARLRAHARNGPPGDLPPVQGTRLTLWMGNCGPILIPWIFAATWVALLRSSWIA
jgi:hypothetical protein